MSFLTHFKNISTEEQEKKKQKLLIVKWCKAKKTCLVCCDWQKLNIFGPSFGVLLQNLFNILIHSGP